MVYTCLCLWAENRSRKTHVFEYRDCGVGWGVGWGGMLTFLVLRTWYIAMLLRSLGLFTTLHVATLLRSLVSFTTLHVATLLRSLGSCTTLHTCCYAAEISGIVYYVTCCYAAEISGIVYYVTCRYAAEISGIVYYVTYMLLRCWDLWDLWELGNGDAFTRMLTASCLLRMRCSDDAEKRKKRAPSFFQDFQSSN